MPSEEQGKAHLVHLQRAELDAAGRMPLAGSGPAVAGGRRAATGARLEEVPNEGLVGARVDALDGDAVAPAPACHGAVGAGRRECPHDRLDDLLPAVAGAQRDGRAWPRPDDGALLHLNLDRPESAVVFRGVGIDQVGERHHHGRLGVGEGGVDDADHLRVAVGQVDLEVAARLGDAGANVDVLELVAVVVEEGLPCIDAIFPSGDDRTHLALGAVEHGLDAGVRRRRAELLHEPLQAPLADARRADHGGQVAAEVARVADVEDDHLVDVVSPLALVVELERRYPEPLLPDLGGGGIVGAVRGAADVALVRAVDRPEDVAVAVEHRHEGGEVGKMVAAAIGVVQQVDVAGLDVALEELADRAGGVRQRADVDRHVLGLRDEAARGVAERGREIPARVQDLRVGRAKHGLAHLLDDRAQPVLDHRDGDGVDLLVHALLPPILILRRPMARRPGRRHCADNRSAGQSVLRSGTWPSWRPCGLRGARGSGKPIARSVGELYS